MSTEHQQYSTENQGDVLREYARRRGLEIVRTFEDAGKRGLRIDGRDALKQLISLVESGRADFEVILVYDVSRWGRFQDADESAYYEYICRRAGISVVYCAEQFENDGSPVSTIVKGVKRAMAGEYSRELSTKVFKGQCRLIELGYRQGGPAGYGLRRMLIDQSGATKAMLRPGEQKSLQTDRVILVPGPESEIATVRRMYEWFTEEGLRESEIARRLNGEGTLNADEEALKELGEKEVTCLLATDDEGYTYNHKVNRLAPIQASRMIQKALREGVSTERIAKALNLSPETVSQRQSLLHGICAEAIDILKDRPIGESALRYVKWVKPLRQIEMAELMVSSGNYTVSYARALAMTSARDQLVSPEDNRKRPRVDELKKHEHEIDTLQRDFKMVDQACGRDVLHLTVFQGYVKKLLDNQRVARFLSQKYPEYLGELRTILDAESLEG